MAAGIMDGKMLAQRLREDVKLEVEGLKHKGITPGLAVIIVGNDPASRIYVNAKKKACEETGIYSEEFALQDDVSQEQLENLIVQLNRRADINGILLQLPIPGHLDEDKLLMAIDPGKDVDGFHPVNMGNLVLGREGFLPCTPAGVMEILKEYNVQVRGRECVVVGRSNIVGKPQALLLLREHGTVTICHSRTANLAEVCRRADILVAAVGKPEIIKGDMLKSGAVVIDVGMNRVEGSKKPVGDVEYETAREKAELITPVPGGVGPMTIAMLLKNTVKAARLAAEC